MLQKIPEKAPIKADGNGHREQHQTDETEKSEVEVDACHIPHLDQSNQDAEQVNFHHPPLFKMFVELEGGDQESSFSFCFQADGSYERYTYFQKRYDHCRDEGDNRDQDITVLVKTDAGVHHAALFLQTERREGHEGQEHGRQVEQKSRKTQGDNPVDAVGV